MTAEATDGPSAQHITDHDFRPITLWWTRCKVCGLGEAAHADTVLRGALRMPVPEKRP